MDQMKKSAVAKQALSEGHHKILVGEVKLVATSSEYNSRLIREAIKIHKHTDNFNLKEQPQSNLKSDTQKHKRIKTNNNTGGNRWTRWLSSSTSSI